MYAIWKTNILPLRFTQDNNYRLVTVYMRQNIHIVTCNCLEHYVPKNIKHNKPRVNIPGKLCQNSQNHAQVTYRRACTFLKGVVTNCLQNIGCQNCFENLVTIFWSSIVRIRTSLRWHSVKTRRAMQKAAVLSKEVTPGPGSWGEPAASIIEIWNYRGAFCSVWILQDITKIQDVLYAIFSMKSVIFMQHNQKCVYIKLRNTSWPLCFYVLYAAFLSQKQ